MGTTETLVDEQWMAKALVLAKEAEAMGEVPIGALVVHAGQVVGQGYNRRETDKDPLGHAELIAIKDAAASLGRWRLNDCTLYVTLEPCAMCAGALVNARVGRLVFACADPKAGAVSSLFELCTDARLNHRLQVSTGVLADECSALLKSFFKALRK